MTNFKLLKSALLVFGFLFLSGCAKDAIRLDSGFWQQSGSKVVIVSHALPAEGGYARLGGEGLLDLAINSAATSDQRAHFKTQQATEFLDVNERFKDELAQRGFLASLHENQVDFEQLEDFDGEKDAFKYDLSEIFDATEADYVLITRMSYFGAVRSYYGFIPTSRPNGYAVVFAWLVDREHNIRWYSGDEEGQVLEPTEDPWDQPPDFPNLTAAMHRAIDRSQDILVQSLFN